jgi:hypothetical protein
MNQDDRDRKLRQVLLEGKVFVDRNEDVKVRLSQSQQLSVGDAGPPHIQDGLRIKSCNVGSKTSVDALVQ